MKFINYLSSIDGVGIYPVISFLIFFSFFILLGIYLFKSDKELIKHMENMPLEGEENQ